MSARCWRASSNDVGVGGRLGMVAAAAAGLAGRERFTS